ncbi:MAG: hypothetical protein K5793_07235 [Nitrosarchaeum sp.]|nr:hypothetical protein [Nitrosarchaeum sp.]
MDLYRAKYSDKKSAKSGKRRFDKDSQSEHRSFRNSNQHSRPESREMFDVTCSDCGVACKIPFEPKFNKPVYCSRCYEKNEPQKSKSSSRDDSDRYSHDRPRYSRDDSRKSSSRGDSRERYSRERPREQYSREDRPRPRYSRENQRSSADEYAPKRTTKFQRRQDIFYSDGSEKFYNSLKEKLFEILGGKMCSSCGFRDSRALGFAHVYDGEAFDQIRRGGFASSWGKYISDPDLAKKELRVLCLNCNEIREPPRKNTSEKPKKSRYFPR